MLHREYLYPLYRAGLIFDESGPEREVVKRGLVALLWSLSKLALTQKTKTNARATPTVTPCNPFSSPDLIPTTAYPIVCVAAIFCTEVPAT